MKTWCRHEIPELGIRVVCSIKTWCIHEIPELGTYVVCSIKTWCIHEIPEVDTYVVCSIKTWCVHAIPEVGTNILVEFLGLVSSLLLHNGATFENGRTILRTIFKVVYYYFESMMSLVYK
jgi:hypothetical protein